MKIIIIGCGKVGLTLAELLSAEKHDVVLIDESSQKLSSIPEELDALRILGNGASVNIQQEAGVEEADLLIAVTGSDELNLLCCLIAKRRATAIPSPASAIRFIIRKSDSSRKSSASP